MRKYSASGLERRKKEREGYSDFFMKHVSLIKSERRKCAECGFPLKGNLSEVCHILPKSFFKSIATNDENVLYMCGMYSDNGCHDKFDGSTEQLQEMTIFKIAQEKVKKLLEIVTENFNYKTTDKWQL